MTLSSAWQNSKAVIGAVSFGLVVGMTFSGWLELPETVEEQGDAIVDVRTEQFRLQARVDSLAGDVRRIRCVVEAVAIKADPVRRCGL